MLKSFLQNATVQRVLRSFLFGLVMVALACVMLSMNYSDLTIVNYVAVGTIIGGFGFVSMLALPAAIGITIIVGGNILWGLYNGVSINVAETVTLLSASGIPILLALWRFLRPQQDGLSA